MNHASYELIYSDGCSVLLKFSNYRSARAHAIRLIKTNKLLKNVEIFNARSTNYHSSTDYKALVEWWGDGSSYWDNMAKENPEILSKKINL